MRSQRAALVQVATSCAKSRNGFVMCLVPGRPITEETIKLLERVSQVALLCTLDCAHGGPVWTPQITKLWPGRIGSFPQIGQSRADLGLTFLMGQGANAASTLGGRIERRPPPRGEATPPALVCASEADRTWVRGQCGQTCRHRLEVAPKRRGPERQKLTPAPPTPLEPWPNSAMEAPHDAPQTRRQIDRRTASRHYMRRPATVPPLSCARCAQRERRNATVRGSRRSI